MSRTTQILIVALLIIILVALCAIGAVLLLRPGSEAEPTATVTLEPTYTATPGAASGDLWERIQAAGKMIVGTSADYPPFEYYTADSRIEGFDIALMDEVGRRLGIAIEYRDFAFDGLGAALQLGQIDAAIAAVSVTPEREGYVDFSNVYFVGSDGVLANADSSISSIESIGDLSNLRIGAQRSTVQDDWLQTNLVDTGQLPADNLLVYERANDAIRDLQQNRLDLVMLDAQPAAAFAQQGGVKLVGQGLNQQRYAIAVPKGASTLTAAINDALLQMNNDGFITALAKEYLNLDPEHILPAPTPTPVPGATSTPVPPPPCLDGLALVQHLSYDDQGGAAPPELKAGQPFTKGWRVQNVGTCTWDSGYRLVFANGNDPAASMGGQPVNIQGQVAPGATYDIQVDLVAPLKPGTYQAFWQMQNGQNVAFGERLPVRIRVPAPPVPTAAPTQTPVPGITFTVNRSDIRAGECVTFNWKVSNVKAVYFFSEGERWQDHGVAGEASQQECPPFTTTYYLRVVKPDDSVDTRQITINVAAAPEAPVISRFTVDPPNQITLGQCVTLRWTVGGSVNSVTITSNGNNLWAGAPVQGNTQDCPSRTGSVAYGITAAGPGGTSQGQQNINVVGEATATPVPPPPPDLPVIHAFSVVPEQINLGDCVNISWTTGGGTSWVTIVRGEHTVWDNAPLSGTVQDCPDAPGDYGYRLVAFNPQDQRVREDRTITVSAKSPR